MPLASLRLAAPRRSFYLHPLACRLSSIVCLVLLSAELFESTNAGLSGPGAAWHSGVQRTMVVPVT